MRFLILFSAALACAAAAPSHLLPYAAYTAIPAIPLGVGPTVSSGDIQAAAINAHVKAADFAQGAVDKARLLSEQAVENLNTQVITNVDQNKERLADAFWATEDKKWQAFDALKTAEAQIDGAIASNADILAKTAVGAPYVAAPYAAPIAPVAPISPLVYSGYVAPALKSFSTQTIIQSHPQAEAEAPKAEGDSEKVEAAVKTAEPAKEAEAEKEKTAEAAAVDAAAELKSEAEKALAALKTPVIAPLAVASAFPYTAAYPYSGLAVAPALAPALNPAVAYAAPGFKYASTVQHVGPLATSTFLKTQW